MDNEELKRKLDSLAAKVDSINISVELTRKYFLATLIISLLLFVLPLLGLLFFIPSFLSTYSSLGSF